MLTTAAGMLITLCHPALTAPSLSYSPLQEESASWSWDSPSQKGAWPAESSTVPPIKATTANFAPEVMAAWINFFKLMLDSIRQNCATPTLPPLALAEVALPTRIGMIAAQTGQNFHLYLMSVVCGHDRKTLVASD